MTRSVLFTSSNALIASQEQRARANIAFNKLLAGDINFEEYSKEVHDSMEEFYKKLEK